MAGEGCNINKDEAEVLKPSSSSSPPSHPSPPPPPPPPPPAAAQPSSLFLKPLHPHEFPVPDRPNRSSEASPPLTAAAPLPRLERERQSVPFGDRCSSCRKRVRLTGFRCRCGDLFCARHRHSDTHDCSFDYKTTGRELIAKANPLIRAAKIIKI